MSNTIQFGIHMGALADPFDVQIQKHCLKFDKKEVESFQRSMDAILQLRFSDLLTDSMLDKIQHKLYNQIKAHVCKQNKIPVNKK